MFKKIFSSTFVIIFSMVVYGLFFNINPVQADPYYDFEVISMKVEPSAPVLNKTSTITVTVKYYGDQDLVDDAGVKAYYYDFEEFDLSSIISTVVAPSAPLEPEETFTYTVKGVFTEVGTANLFFRTNNNQAMPEPNTSDNDIRMNVEVVYPNDILVSDISVLPSVPAAGQDGKITVKIKNAGHDDLNNNIGIQEYNYSFEDFDIEESKIPNVSSLQKFLKGEFIEFVFDGYFVSPGDKKMSFEINTGNRLDENNYNNNSLEKTIAIGAVDNLDISVDSIDFSKDVDKLLVGDTVSIVAKIKNNSGFSITEDTGLLERDYNYSEGGDYSFKFEGFDIESVTHTEYPSVINSLGPDKFFNYTFTGRLTQAGTEYIEFGIDTRDKLKEIDENNNKKTAAVTVYGSKEELYDFTFYNINSEPISSTSVRISWTNNRETDCYFEFKRGGYSAYDRYLLYLGWEEWPESKKKEAHILDLDGIENDREYLGLIHCVNGEISKTSELIGFNTPANDEFSFSAPPALKLEAGKVILNWETNLLADAWVYYRPAGEEKYSNIGAESHSLKHELAIEGLAGGVYEYYAMSNSLFGRELRSDTGTFSIGNIEAAESSAPADASAEGSDPGGAEGPLIIENQSLYGNLKGNILLKVEDEGRAYYVHPEKMEMHYLGRPDDAFRIMREQGIGISNRDLGLIPVGLNNATGIDSDGDGLSDLLEDAIGTDKNNLDSDSDGYGDRDELSGGYDPRNALGAKLDYDSRFAAGHKGKIFLQVENNGEAWYINPKDSKRYFLGRPADAFEVMRFLSLGISNADFNTL